MWGCPKYRTFVTTNLRNIEPKPSRNSGYGNNAIEPPSQLVYVHIYAYKPQNLRFRFNRTGSKNQVSNTSISNLSKYVESDICG